jgi:hypothetical protein
MAGSGDGVQDTSATVRSGSAPDPTPPIRPGRGPLTNADHLAYMPHQFQPRVCLGPLRRSFCPEPLKLGPSSFTFRTAGRSVTSTKAASSGEAFAAGWGLI